MNSTEEFRQRVQVLIRRRQSSDLREASDLLLRWAAWDVKTPEPWQRLVEIRTHERRFGEALQALEQFERRHGDTATASYLRAVLLQLQGKLSEALAHYSAAIERSRKAQFPQSPDQAALDPAALAAAAAMQACETASGAYPGSSHRQDEGMFDCAPELENLERSLRLWEDSRTGVQPHGMAEKFADAWYNLGCAALASYTANDRRIDLFQKAIDLNPSHVLARLNRVFSANYSTVISPGESAASHRELGRWLESRYGRERFHFKNDRTPRRRLRVGYLSSDFRNHSVANFILPVIEHHDPARFDLTIYYNHAKRDEITERARSAVTHFKAVRDLSDLDLCRLIRNDGIDILIDLNGLTQYNRMAVLAMRAAPIQITWMGYPNSTGLGTVDYRIVDRITDPTGQADALHTEQLLYMPHTFSVYEAPADLPPVNPTPGAHHEFITFGSFNALPKLNDELVRIWSAILQQLPGSRILLKNSAFSFESPQREVLTAFARHGVGAERIGFLGYVASRREHLAAYERIDIALDTFPYTGTTTTCESLIMGVPVITRSGRDHRSRVGAALLHAVGLDSLVTTDENAYIDAAVRLANDLQQLEKLRNGLRERMQMSALMDSSSFTKELERQLLAAWERWCQEGK